MSKKINYVLSLNYKETFPKPLMFMRSEEVFKYENGKKTDILEGYKVFVLDTNTMSETSVKVIGEVPEIEEMKPVAFEGVECVPYINRNGNFSNLEYSVKAKSVKAL